MIWATFRSSRVRWAALAIMVGLLTWGDDTFGQGGPPGGPPPGAPGGPPGGFDRSRFRGGGPDDESPDSRQRRQERYEGYLKEMDVNHDGVIDAKESEKVRRDSLERMYSRLGLEMKFPMPVSKVRDALGRYVRSGPATPSSASVAAAPAASNSASSSPMGFGAPSGSTVQGFGDASKPTASGATGASPASSGSSSTSTSSGGASGSPTVDPRIRGYAQSLLRQYDANKNGVLEKSEWSKMSMDPSSGDKNKDGVLSLDELTEWLVAYTQSRYGGRKPEPSTTTSTTSTTASSTPSSTSSSTYSRPVTSTTTSVSGASSSGSSYASRPAFTPSASSSLNSAPAKKSYRILSPAERLPRGLPDWFLQKDANRDGQVSMSEYSGTWSDEAAAEFAKYDLNNDGVITAEEVLRYEKRGRK